MEGSYGNTGVGNAIQESISYVYPCVNCSIIYTQPPNHLNCTLFHNPTCSIRSPPAPKLWSVLNSNRQCKPLTNFPPTFPPPSLIFIATATLVIFPQLVLHPFRLRKNLMGRMRQRNEPNIRVRAFSPSPSPSHIAHLSDILALLCSRMR